MDWQKLESVIGETVPDCLKKVLTVCGYDTFSSLMGIQNESILCIEKIVNDHFRATIANFDCCHAEFYKKSAEFKFLQTSYVVYPHLNLLLKTLILFLTRHHCYKQ